MSEPDLDIPLNLQPDPDDLAYDLDTALRAVVGLRATVPADAFTAETLGTERIGSGVAIRGPGLPDGLVLTIGYLITEAETVWLTTNDARVLPGHALAYDQATGFGLVLALGRLDLPARCRPPCTWRTSRARSPGGRASRRRLRRGCGQHNAGDGGGRRPGAGG